MTNLIVAYQNFSIAQKKQETNIHEMSGIFFFYVSFIDLHRQYIWLLWSNNSGFEPDFANNEATSHLRLRPHGNRDRSRPPKCLPGRYNPSWFHTNFID
jgi:hypothetical protein